MNVRRHAACTLFGSLLLLPCAATAQTAGSPPRVSVGAGAGLALPFHGDFDFTPWAWDADVRVALSRHVLLEAAVGEWRHTETFTREAIPVTPAGGVIGRLDQTTTRVQQITQANLLFTAARGRVRVTAGGGVGVLQHRRRSRQVATDCSAGATCGSFESTVSNASGSAQAVGGVEAGLAAGLALFGQVRFVVPFTDPGGSDLRVTSGLRWGFR